MSYIPVGDVRPCQLLWTYGPVLSSICQISRCSRWALNAGMNSDACQSRKRACSTR